MSCSLFIAALMACSSEPCVCAPAAAADCGAAAPIKAAVSDIVSGSPRAQLALETYGQLFAHDYAPIRKLLTPELAADLTAAKLSDILAGLERAHGLPVQVMDAWATTITEKEERMPAAQVLMRMANDTRLSLMLVFTPEGAVRGLWLRPI